MFSTGTSAKPLTEMEQSDVIYRLVSVYNRKTREIAMKIGRNQQYVTHLLSLHAAPMDVKEAVLKKKLSPSAAVLVSKANPEKRAKVMEKVRETSGQEKVIISDIEKITKGTPTAISAKSIKDKITHVDKLIAQATEPSGMWITYLENVKFGLEVALGISTLPPLA
jgi:RNA processing factor Prp31